ncbi:hypothetical protein CKO17_00755 [Marichromatium gracile]|nr:hypothetical protein [Marichromatium gracile]
MRLVVPVRGPARCLRRQPVLDARARGGRGDWRARGAGLASGAGAARLSVPHAVARRRGRDRDRRPAATGGYVVQAGSFKRNADAETLRAELALLGLSSRIERVTLDSGAVYHRVRLGPYANKADAERVRAQLQRAGKDGLTLPAR